MDAVASNRPSAALSAPLARQNVRSRFTGVIASKRPAAITSPIPPPAGASSSVSAIRLASLSRSPQRRR